jgi:hypothetical protein
MENLFHVISPSPGGVARDQVVLSERNAAPSLKFS